MFELDHFDIEDDDELMYRQYMAAGIRVIPLHKIAKSNDALVCGCGNPECVTTGKHPVADGWQNAPMWDDEQVETMRSIWGQLHPGFGALIRDGLLIVDVDERNGGAESQDKLEKKLGISFKSCAGFAVQTGSGGRSAHYYFRQKGEPKKLRQALSEYPGIDFKSTGFVVGCGSPHASGNSYEKMKGWPEDVGEPPADLMEMLEQKSRLNVVVNGVSRDLPFTDLEKIVMCVRNDGADYEHWVRVGMGLHDATNGSDDGYQVWCNWSNLSDKHDERSMPNKWRSFSAGGDDNVTVGTLIKWAKENGYIEPVTFDSDVFKDVEQEKAGEVANSLAVVALAEGVKPWDIPGYAGKVYQWIDGQCRYPRQSITAGATLYALSCIGGMRHTDERDDMTLNMMVFNVAGTGTGKENVNQAVTELFSRIGIVSAMHGKIKSEQEIYRNLMRNQCAFYNIDEIGIMLNKISQAAKGSGASYLVAIIGALMEIYSKANGILAVTGDLKDEIKEKVLIRIAQINKRQDSGNGDAKALESELDLLKKELKDADEGIVSPYLALMGTTTPETFDSTMTEENAKNGFIARALIMREQENNPRWKPGFKKIPLEPMMFSRLSTLYWAGHTAGASERVERIGDKKKIITDSEADHALNECYEYFWLQGESHKSRTGLEGITRRGWEMVSKISLILAMADGGVRTLDHVVYGFALAKSDVALKIEYAYSANEEAQDAITVRLLSRLSFDEPLTRGQVNRVLKSNTAATQELIDSLKSKGYIKVEDSKNENGRPTEYIVRLK